MSKFDPDFIFQTSLKARIYDVCIRSPLDLMDNLSKKTKNNIWLKREDMQPTRSFKIRGALCFFDNLAQKKQTNEVVAASAGNHAQGVALAAKIKNRKAVIFMPHITPQIKIDSVKSLGAKINLVGKNLGEAYQLAQSYVKKKKSLFVNGFDDPYIMAGQATIGLEIVQDCPQIPDAIFVPVGGGGLISGIAIAVKKLYPQVKIIGVEPVDNNSMYQSIQQGKVLNLTDINTFAEGVAVPKVGEMNFECCRQFVDDFINITSDEICFAIKLIHDDVRAIAEPSGAVALAGALSYIKKRRWKNKNIVTINSGSNVDFDRFRYISERVNIGAGREMLYAIELKEYPGTLKRFCKRALKNLKISEFCYRYYDKQKAVVLLGIADCSMKDKKPILERIRKYDYNCYDMTNDELTKNHLKYMIGGRLKNLGDERVFQFNFPDTQDALVQFLEKMNNAWNISLLHFRSYNTDYCKVFLGVQTPPKDKELLDDFLDKLNYSYSEETKNNGYKLFLSA